MIAIKGMELQTDCKKCPFMATDGVDLLSPMMCLALWATKHEVKHCVEGKILNDCPLVEIVTCKDCKYNDEGTCHIDGFTVCDASARRKDKMSEEELERIKKEEFRKGVSSVWTDIAKVTQGIGDYNCLYNAVHGIKNYPNGFKVKIFALDEDKKGENK